MGVRGNHLIQALEVLRLPGDAKKTYGGRGPLGA